MDIQKENNLIKEAFEVEADEIGFCLDQEWGDYENPYENSDTALAFNLFKKGWQAAKAQAVQEGFVLVSHKDLLDLAIAINAVDLATHTEEKPNEVREMWQQVALKLMALCTAQEQKG